PVAARGQVLARVTLEPARLNSDWHFTLDWPEGARRSLVVGSSEPLAAPPVWRLAGEGEEAAPPLAARPLDEAERVNAGLDPQGSAWEVELPRSHAERVRLKTHLESVWTGHGRLPLLSLARSFDASASLLILVDRDTRSV